LTNDRSGLKAVALQISQRRVVPDFDFSAALCGILPYLCGYPNVSAITAEENQRSSQRTQREQL